MTFDWMPLLRGATDDLATTLAEGDLDAPVPSCPDWTLADLGGHVRWVHLWAAHAVSAGTPDGNPEPVAREQLVAGYRDAARELIEVLEEAGPQGSAWTFGPEPVAAFWQRRQVHEVTLHLYDALLSQGRESAWKVDPELAWDGVDEVTAMFYPRQVRLGRSEPLTSRLILTATDVGRTTSIGEGEPVELTGTAADLLLTLWKRVPATGADVMTLLASTAVTP